MAPMPPGAQGSMSMPERPTDAVLTHGTRFAFLYCAETASIGNFSSLYTDERIPWLLD